METRDDLFVVVRRGDPADAENAIDIVVVDDQQLVRTFGSLIAKRLGGHPLTALAPQPLRPVPAGTRGPGDGEREP